METVIEQRQRRAKLISDAGAILSAALDEKREMSDDESARFDKLHADAAGLLRQIRQREAEADLSEPLGGALPGERRDEAVLVGTDREGRPVWGYRHGTPIPGRSASAEEARTSLGGCLRGLLTGNWSGFDAERRALSSGSATAGGILLPSPVSTRFVNLARNKAQVSAAGALTVPIDGAELTIARQTGDPTVAWLQESATMTESEATFDGIVFRPKTCGAYVKIPLELAEDSANVGRIVEDALTAAIGLELDRVALSGSGAGAEPRGIANTTGVQTSASIGTPTDYSKFSLAVQAVATQNGMATAILMHPRDLGVLDRLVTATELQPLTPPASWQQLRKFPTTQCRTTLGAGAESEAFCGDFTNVLLGMRRDVTIEAFRAANDSAGSAFTQRQVWIRAYARFDVGIARPAHLVYMSGITIT